MKKIEWIEYFEALNGRAPSDDELAQAQAAGEFVDDAAAGQVQGADLTAGAAPVNPAPQAQEQAYYQQAAAMPQYSDMSQAAQPFQGQAAQPQAYYQQAPAGQAMPNYQIPAGPAQPSVFANFLSWLGQAFKNPQAESENSHLGFGLGTVAVASLFGGWTLINFVRRVLNAVINLSGFGLSLKDLDEVLVSGLQAVVGNNFGFVGVLLAWMAFFVTYVVVMGLPVFFNKDMTKNFGQKLGQYFSYSPLILVLNFLAFLTTFLVPRALVVTNLDVFDTIDDSTSYGTWQLVQDAVPAIKTALLSGRIAFFLVGFTFLIVLIALINNMAKVRFGKLNQFYVALLSGLVYILIMAIFGLAVRGLINDGIQELGRFLGELSNF